MGHAARIEWVITVLDRSSLLGENKFRFGFPIVSVVFFLRANRMQTFTVTENRPEATQAYHPHDCTGCG